MAYRAVLLDTYETLAEFCFARALEQELEHFPVAPASGAELVAARAVEAALDAAETRAQACPAEPLPFEVCVPVQDQAPDPEYTAILVTHIGKVAARRVDLPHEVRKCALDGRDLEELRAAVSKSPEALQAKTTRDYAHNTERGPCPPSILARPQSHGEVRTLAKELQNDQAARQARRLNQNSFRAARTRQMEDLAAEKKAPRNPAFVVDDQTGDLVGVAATLPRPAADLAKTELRVPVQADDVLDSAIQLPPDPGFGKAAQRVQASLFGGPQ